MLALPSRVVLTSGWRDKLHSLFIKNYRPKIRLNVLRVLSKG
jgi:hypothetical protein